jgi:CheY-like chemotaxis protein
MNTNVIGNQEWSRPRNSLIDITPLTRVLQIRHPAFISPGIADFYQLSSCPQIGGCPALDDLVWAISQAVDDSTATRHTATRPWPSASGPAMLLEFSSFVHSTSDAQVVQAVITTIRTLPDRARFLVSLPSEGAQQNLPLVLVAEAETEIVRALRWVLGRRGFTTIAAATGAEALQRAEEAQPDLILLDADLPGNGALAVCARLCADPRTKTIPVVLCSAWMGGADAALKAGATAYLEKPLGFGDLPERLHQVLLHQILAVAESPESKPAPNCGQS